MNLETNQLSEELAGYCWSHPIPVKELERLLEIGPGLVKVLSQLPSKAKKPTITKVKGGDWQYKGSKVEIHLELGQGTS